MFFLSKCDAVAKEILTKENINEEIDKKINEEDSRLELIIAGIFADVISFVNLSVKNIEKTSVRINEDRKNKFFSTLNILKEEVSNSKTISDLLDKIYEFYLSDDEFIKSISLGAMASIGNGIVNYIDDLNYAISPFKKCKKKIEKFIEDFENDKVVSVEDAKEILNLYNMGDANLNDLAIEEEVKKHNDEARKREKLSKENIVRVEKHYETREERMAMYNNKDSEYKDVGDVKLTLEELECLDLYFSVVEELDERQLEDFENKTANYISYVEGTHYKEILEELIIKIQNSTDISKNIKSKGIKAINALKRTI